MLVRSVSVLALFLLPLAAGAASLSLGGSTGTVGSTVAVPITVTTASGEVMNAVSANLSFPADKLSVVSVSKSPSIITLWAQEPSFSNSAGTVSLEGVVPNPGFSGSGRVATVVFRVKASGSATVALSQASVLANDGRGTNILTSSPAHVLTLTSAAPVPAPTPAPASAPVPAPSTVATTSTTSEPISEALPPPHTATASDYLPIGLAAALIIILAAVIILLMYGWHRLLCLTHDLAKERTEADKLIRKSFTILKHDLAQHTQRLRRAAKARTLTSEEVAFLEEFTDELEEAETYLEKKLNPDSKKDA